MIFDSLQRTSLYEGLSSGLAAALRYVRSVDPAIPDGVYELDGEQLVARVQSYETIPEAEQQWESHRSFVDVQVVLSGEEQIIYAPAETLRATTSYDSAMDLIRYEGRGEAVRLTLKPGSFAIFFPDDAHKPGVAISGPAAVRKVVMKVAVW